MKRKEHREKQRTIHRKFEPDRLSPTRLADAYEQVVPKRIRVLEEASGEKAHTYQQQTSGV